MLLRGQHGHLTGTRNPADVGCRHHGDVERCSMIGCISSTSSYSPPPLFIVSHLRPPLQHVTPPTPLQYVTSAPLMQYAPPSVPSCTVCCIFPPSSMSTLAFAATE